MGFGDFLKGAAESVGKRIDDAAEGAGEVATDVVKTVAADARESAHDVNQWRQGDVGDPRSLIGGAGGLAGDTLRTAGSLISTGGDVITRADSWLNPHDNMSEAEWTQSYTDFVGEHGEPKTNQGWGESKEPYKDDDISWEYKDLMGNRPLGLKDQNEFNILGDKLKGGGNAVEAISKGTETFSRSPVESTEFAWDNKGEIARQTTNYVQSQFTPEALGQWAAAAGAGLAIATARSGRGRGATPHAPTPHLELPAPSGVSTPMAPPAPIRTSQFSRGVIPTTFPKTRTRIANAISGPAEAQGLVPTARRIVGRKFEPQGLPPSQRPGSSAAEAGTSRFTESMWEVKQWAARAGGTKLAYDIASGGERIPSELADKYDPEQVAEGLSEYNDFAAGRPVQRVARDMLTDPSQRAEALERAEDMGLDTKSLASSAESYANQAFPSWKDYVIPGGLAAGGAAAAASSLLRGRGQAGENPVQAVQQAAAQQTSGESQGYSPMYKQQQAAPSGTSLTMPRMDSFGAGTTAKPGKAARPAAVSDDYGYREPSVQHPLGSGLADGSEGPSKSPLYAGINQPGPRMQPGERKRGESFVSGSVHGEKGATMSGTLGWNAQTKGSYIFPELTQPPNTKKPREVLGV